MENEKFINYYVEIMTNTLTDAVVRNISLQTNAKITEDVIKELEKVIKDNNEIFEERERLLQEVIEDHKNTIVHLNDEIANLNTMRNQYESVLHQTQHLDTFRTQLIETRAELDKQHDAYESKIKELNERIEYLQLTPAKKKKVDEMKQLDPQTETVIEDGGSF